MNSGKTAVLFVCTGNAGRSQFAEELFRKITPEHITVMSAGVRPWEHVHPIAAKLLADRNIDIRRKKPRHVRDLVNESFGLVVTIGGPARDKTPCYPGEPVRVHWDINDPADADGTPDSESVFRRTLSAIEQRLDGLLEVVRHAVPDVPPFSPGISTAVVGPELRFQPEKHVPLIAQAGFSCIELNCGYGVKDFDWKSPQTLQELTSVCQNEGVKIRSIHMPCNYPRTHVDETMARDYVEKSKVFCEIAVQLGAKVLVIHALKTNKEGPPEWDEIMHQIIKDMAQHVLALPLVLGLENLNWRVAPAEDIKLIQSYSTSAMGFVFDNGHSHIFGASDEYLDLCGLRLYSLHIQDGNGIKDEHLLPGKGTVDWKNFMKRVVQTGYTGPLMLEVQDRREQKIGLIQYLKECMASVRMLQSYIP